MRLLVDQNLPQRLVMLLRSEGYDAVHTEDVGLATTGDPQILSWCCSQRRVLVTADKKLTKFLASSGADCPSVLITQELRTTPADEVAAILIANLPQIEERSSTSTVTLWSRSHLASRSELSYYHSEYQTRPRDGRGGRYAGEHLIAAARALYNRATADGLLAADASPAHGVIKPRRLPSVRQALTASELDQINTAARSSGNDPILDAILLRLHTETACRRGGALARSHCE